MIRFRFIFILLCCILSFKTYSFPQKSINNYISKWLTKADKVLVFNYKTGKVIYSYNSELFNNSIPIGSVFKVISTYAFLKQNDKALNYSYVCKPSANLFCWKKSGHGKVFLKDAFVHSCNHYFYSLNIDMDFLEKQSSIFGLNINLKNLNKREQKLVLAGNHNRVRANIYELATLISIFANNGKSVDIRNGQPNKYKIWEKDILFKINDYMFDVIQKGTARNIKFKKHHFSGKTGTSKGENNKLNGVFIGFIRKKHYGIVVHLNNQIGSSASMIASDILFLLLKD